MIISKFVDILEVTKLKKIEKKLKESQNVTAIKEKNKELKKDLKNN